MCKISAPFLNRIPFFSITHKDYHFATTTKKKKKMRENLMKNKKVKHLKSSPPPLFYVKNGNSYIVTLCIYLKGIFIWNSLPRKIISKSDEK